ncbi:MAG: hypothetical protein HOQ02_01195 [Lysobacter sp.]|nr:hypothetical protein [Lysobacter sp.]
MSALTVFGLVLTFLGLAGFVGSLVLARWASKQPRDHFPWVWATYVVSLLLMVAVGPAVAQFGVTR